MYRRAVAVVLVGLLGMRAPAAPPLQKPVVEIALAAGAGQQASQLVMLPDRRVDYSVDGKLVAQIWWTNEQVQSFLGFLEKQRLPRAGKLALQPDNTAWAAMREQIQRNVLGVAAGHDKSRNEAEERQKRLAEADRMDSWLRKAVEFVRRNNPQATVRPLQSENIHLGVTLMPQVMNGSRYYGAVLRETKAAPQRAFVVVADDGNTGFVTEEQVARKLGEQDKGRWQDGDYLNAAMLRVHVTSVANEDGWKLLKKPEDFTAITFNMGSVGPGVDRQREAAKAIAAPQVAREAGTVTVQFHAWHLIGGALLKWTVTFGAPVSAVSESLGQFGGGGYD